MELIPVQRFEYLGYQEFQEWFYQPQVPVIFRSFAKDWLAWDLWDFEFFKQDAGDVPVDVYGSWTRNHPTKISRVPQQVMPFREYLQHIESGPTEYRLFLFNLFRHKPNYRQHFTFPEIASGWLKSRPFLFFGGRDSDVRLHFDIDLANVFLTQFEGEKRVLLFAPNQSRALYHQPFSTHSNVDMSQPDYARYPAIAGLRGFEGNLLRGDTLFMPSGYWHYMYYTTSGFSLAQRTLASTPLKKARAVYNLLLMKTIDDLFSTIAQRAWPQYKLRKASSNAEKSRY